MCKIKQKQKKERKKKKLIPHKLPSKNEDEKYVPIRSIKLALFWKQKRTRVLEERKLCHENGGKILN